MKCTPVPVLVACAAAVAVLVASRASQRSQDPLLIEGTVVDTQGEPLQGVTVMAHRGDAAVGKAVSDQKGEYKLSAEFAKDPISCVEYRRTGYRPSAIFSIAGNREHKIYKVLAREDEPANEIEVIDAMSALQAAFIKTSMPAEEVQQAGWAITTRWPAYTKVAEARSHIEGERNVPPTVPRKDWLNREIKTPPSVPPSDLRPRENGGQPVAPPKMPPKDSLIEQSGLRPFTPQPG